MSGDDTDTDPIVSAIDGAEPRAGPASSEKLAWEPCNDYGNSRRLKDRRGEDLLYTKEHGWLAWTGTHFDREDGDAVAQIIAQDVAAQIALEADCLEGSGEEADKARAKTLRSWCRQSGNAQRLHAMLSVAAPHLRARAETFDIDPWKLATPNATLHLKGHDGGIGQYDHRRADRITRLAGARYDLEAKAPRFRRFISEILPDEATADWVQRWLGYCLSGCIAEQRIAIFEGKGSNGKSTLLNVVAAALGDYADSAPIEAFLYQERRGSSGPTPEIARLPGARMVRTSEPEPGARLSESVIKQITGDEPMTARHLNRPIFEFVPSFKLTMSVNHRPVIVGKDHGIKRRVVLVPFTQRFEKRGPGLKAELMAELPGVLNWLLDGLQMYFQEGLDLPEPVAAATEAYFAEMDPIGQFIADACKEEPDAEEESATLFAGYKLWCAQANEEHKNNTQFGRRLNDLGFRKKKTGGRIKRLGLRLRDEFRPMPGGGDD
ncbi:MAG: phage/plasmid primase, P4 family [Dichotomicrobium sp.]